MSAGVRLLVGVVFVAFAGLNLYVVEQYGYLGFWRLVTANAATIAAMVDLTIALSRARRRPRPGAPRSADRR